MATYGKRVWHSFKFAMWLIGNALLQQEVTVFRCSHCGYGVLRKISPCPNCDSSIEWVDCAVKGCKKEGMFSVNFESESYCREHFLGKYQR